MSMSQEDEGEEAGGSTIIMVDTCGDSEDSNREDKDCNTEDEESTELFQDIVNEGLYCIVCNEKFEIGDEGGLADHMKLHEEPFQEDLTSSRGLSKRKASLSVRNTYKSLIPSSGSSKTKKEKGATKRSRKGKVTVFKEDIMCKPCNMKFKSRRQLKIHES